MGADTAIEWAHHTFNPWTGCTKVSPGCDHCYAESWAKRSGTVEWGDHPRRRTSAATWRQPLKWNDAALAAGTRARVFCASLADVFDNQAPEEWRADLARLIEATPALDWLLLTKRIGNAEKMLRAMFPAGVPSNVWLGATVVNQQEANRDASKLLGVKERLRISIAFLSIEPLLGPIDLTCLEYDDGGLNALTAATWGELIDQWRDTSETWEEDFLDWFDLSEMPDERARAHATIDWVIVGGESGPKARPMHPDWARALRGQCATAGVPFLFKQWGEWHPWGDKLACGNVNLLSFGKDPARYRHLESIIMSRVGKARAGRRLDGVEHNGFPEVRA